MFTPDTKELLTFDCYGTLIDWETGILSALQPLLRSYGVSLDDERVLEVYAGFEAALESGSYMTYRAVVAACLRGFGERYGFVPSDADQAAFADSVGDWPAFPDTPAALAILKQHYKLAILSNTDDDLFARSNQKLGVTFDYIITAQQVGSYKPAHTHFHVALERTGIPKERILHIAQSLFHDHVPAKALGFDTVWVNRRYNKPGQGATPPANATPDLEVPDMASVVRAIVPA